MNKIKVLYDVFKTMKEKEVFKGSVKLEATKGDVKVLSFSNEFETNTKSGETKANISVDLDAEGKKVKHDSNSEFNIKECPDHGFHRGMHNHGMNMHGMHGHGGIKGGLSKVTFILNLLNNVQVEEKDEKAIISLELKEVFKEIKDMHKEFHKGMDEEKIMEHIRQMKESDDRGFHKHHKFIKELLCSENSDAILKIYANKNNEVEKVEISSKGENAVNGSLDLVW
ncbi:MULTISPECIES: hypothetical protein [Clostridium]|jgi:hypothetical protein|uniref:Uncharacterized protein n=2 Tax=Clostridium beijerinckii TaxID=1520 RepID=A0AAE2RNJ4_CLOBE|nr:MULTISPECIES: hypothetical protein [Clostridium]ABR36701.1 hypothetical protein Cbei_4593 [Clostridium beijerinckii NCIMB 8052]AIU05193.1 hypothetical protein Cbs_4593 [Clostridium beijerinckii ATCC 35702]AVK48527.1 hypothetical protein AXY43_11025 [Clostridium sp. MF28]MBF7808652.1 hypothetical protein [Clostridium beijerinckii]NOW89130.1 hypothetical protein [Clostridium beijerinckii]